MLYFIGVIIDKLLIWINLVFNNCFRSINELGVYVQITNRTDKQKRDCLPEKIAVFKYSVQGNAQDNYLSKVLDLYIYIRRKRKQ